MSDRVVARLCFYCVFGGVRSRWKLENIAKPYYSGRKQGVRKISKSRSNLEFGVVFWVILGTMCKENLVFSKKKYAKKGIEKGP